MSKYRQIETKMWIDENFTALSVHAKLLFIWLFTNPNSGLSGVQYFNIVACSTETGLSQDEIKEAIKELTLLKRIVYDEKYSIIWVINQFKYSIRGDKIMLGVINELDRIGLKHIKTMFYDYYKYDFMPYGVDVIDELNERGSGYDTPSQS